MDIATLSMRVDSGQLTRGREELGRFAGTAKDADRNARGAESAVGGLTSAFGGLSKYVGLATKAFSGLSVAMVFGRAVRESEQLQRNMLRTQAIIHATGGVAGRTAEQLHQQARSLASATLASTEGVMQAQQTLLTFRNIRGEVFDQAIQGALDLAAAMGQDLNSATLQLAKALEDPITGMTALTRSGTVFTEAQKDMVRGMVEAGRTMDAQAFILAELAAQYGGVAAKEAEGLAGAQDTLAQAVQEAAIELNAVLNLTGRLASGYRAVADAVNFLAANMERIVYYAGVAVVAFGTRFAVAMAIAAARTFTLAGALTALGGALIRTGIGALVVGAGELAYQFSGLVRATGSFGDAMSLVKDVAVEAWGRIERGAKAVGYTANAMFLDIKSWAANAFASAIENVVAFGNTTVNTFRGAYFAVEAVWSALPDMFRRVAAQAANAMIEIMQTAVAGVTAAVNALLTLGGRNPQWAIAAPDLSAWEVAVPAAVDIGNAAAEGFARGFEENILDVPDLGLEEVANKAIASANTYRDAAKDVAAGARAPLDSIKALRDAVSGAAEDTEDGASAADRLNDALGAIGGDGGGGGGGGGGSAGAAAKAIEGAKTAAEGFAESLQDAAITAEDMGKEKAGILVSGIDSIANAWGDFVASGFTSFSEFASGIWRGFQQLVSQMVALALKNRIMISLGIGGGGLSGAAAGLAGSAGGGGGLLSGLLGSIGGGAGFMGGLGNAVSGGIGGILSVGANAAAAGGGFMATLGAAVPVLGIAAAALSIFVAKTKTLDAGLRVTVDGMDALVQSFAVVEKSRLFGLIKSTSTSTSAAAAEIADPITAAIADIQAGVLTAADALGIGASAFEGFATAVDISTAGMGREEAVQAVLEGLGAVADDMAEMVPGLAAVALTGETASVTLTRLAADLGQVNKALDAIGMTVFEIGVEGAAAASEIVQALGGSDGFATAFNAFVQGFYSDAERLDMLTRDLQAAFGDLGLVMPQTRVEFRQLVEGMDLSTAAGRALYAEVLALAGAMDQALPSVEYLTAAVYGLVLDVAGDVQASITAAEQSARASEQAAELWYRTSETLRDFLADLTGSDLGGQDAFSQLASRQAEYERTLAAAQAGDADAAAAFPAIARELLDSALAVSSTEQDYQQFASQVIADTNLLAGIAGLEGATEDVLETLYRQQIAVLESLAAFLTYEGLTDDQIAELDESISAFVANWDQSLGEFEAALASIEAAIAGVGAVTYDAMQQGVELSIAAIYAAGYDDVTEALLIAAAEGIAVTVDFVLRQDLPPDLLWLAVNTSSQHIATLDVILGNAGMSVEEINLALAATGTINRQLNIILASGVDDDLLRLALVGTSELSRVVNVILASGADPEIVELALTDIAYMAIAIEASLDPDVDDAIRALVYTDVATFALIIEASFDLDEDQQRILLGQAGVYAVNVTAILITDNMDDATRSLLIEANTAAILSVAVAFLFPDEFTDDEIAKMLSDATEVLMTISVAINTANLAPDELLYLQALGGGTDVVIRALEASMTEDMNATQLGILEQLMAGDGSVQRDIAAEIWAYPANSMTEVYLDLYGEGLDYEQFIRDIEGAITLVGLDANGELFVAVFDTGAEYEEYLRQIEGALIAVQTDSAGTTWINVFGDGADFDSYIRAIQGEIVVTAFDENGDAFLMVFESGQAVEAYFRTINGEVVVEGYDDAGEAFLLVFDTGADFADYYRTITGEIVTLTYSDGAETFMLAFDDGAAFEEYLRTVTGSIEVLTITNAGDQFLTVFDAGQDFDEYLRQINALIATSTSGQTANFIAVFGDGAAAAEFARTIEGQIVVAAWDANGDVFVAIWDAGQPYEDFLREVDAVITAVLSGDAWAFLDLWDDGQANGSVSRTLAANMTVSANALAQDWIAVVVHYPSTTASTLAADMTISASALEQDWLYVVTGDPSVKVVLAADMTISASALEQDWLTAALGDANAKVTLAAAMTLSASAAQQDWLIVSSGSATKNAALTASMTLSASAAQQDWLIAVADYPGTISRTIGGLLTLPTLTKEQSGFLSAISGVTGSTVTLAGGVQLDVSSAFQIWYEGATEDLIANPMEALSSSMDALRAAVDAQLHYMQLDAMQAELAYLETVVRAAETAQSTALVAEVHALEAATGVQLMNNNKDATLKVNDAGNINYAATSVAYSASSDLNTFSDEFWSDGGLEDQILAQQQDVWDLNADANALRNQITNMGGVPMYARGGFHGGGLAIVGEEGPELAMFGGASRIYSARDTADMLDGAGDGSTADEIAALRDEMRQLLMAVAKNTRRTAQNTDEMVATGIPVRTEGTDTVATV